MKKILIIVFAVTIVVLFGLMIAGQRYDYAYRNTYLVGRTDKWTGEYQRHYGNEWVGLEESARRDSITLEESAQRYAAYREEQKIEQERRDSIAIKILFAIADHFLARADSLIQRNDLDEAGKLLDSATLYTDEAKRREARK